MDRAEKVRERVEAELADSDVARGLLEVELFQVWLDEQLEDAERRCVLVIANHTSNYEKAMTAGILRYWKAKRLEMEKIASKDYRQKRIKRLEELNAEPSGERKSRSGPFSGIKAFGQF